MSGATAGQSTLTRRASSIVTAGGADIPGRRAPDEALYQFKLLEALRSGQIAEITPFLQDLSKSNNATLAAALINRAVRVSDVDTVRFLLSQKTINVNSVHPPNSGTTPLHVAAELGRLDMVQLLLEQPDLDDTLRNEKGQSCIEVASSDEVVDLILRNRASLQSLFLQHLSTYVSLPTPTPAAGSEPIIHLLSGPRASLLDINALDAKSGTTLLHEAVRRKDSKLVRFLTIDKHADVFVRDRKGRRVGVEGEVGEIASVLKQAANNQKAIGQTADGKPKPARGYLMKYTNVAHGYKSRWFVLNEGTLDYYRNQEEEGKFGRGSITLPFAIVKSTSSTGFDIQPGPGARFKAWSVKASHPQEAANWTQSLKQHIEYYKAAGLQEKNALQTTSTRSSISSLRSSGVTPSHIFTTPSYAPQPMSRQDSSPSMSIDDETGDDVSVKKSKGHRGLGGIPHADTFALDRNTVKAHLEITNQLVDSLVVSSPAPSITSSSEPKPLGRSNTALSVSRQQSVKDGLKDSMKVLGELIEDYQQKAAEREAWLTNKYQREVDAKLLWEQSMQEVAAKEAEMERDLMEASRENTEHRKALKKFTSPGYSATLEATGSQDGFPISGTATSLALAQQKTKELTTPAPNKELPAVPVRSPQLAPTSFDPSHPDVSIQLPTAPAVTDGVTIIDDDDDDDDEFFDAIESGALPVQIPEELSRGGNSHPEANHSSLPKEEGSNISLAGMDFYKQLRHRLPIDSDQRPPVSLWAILKSSIGKDLTRISFPVLFNEPTSMLQRMAEDMEFSECLDAASANPDSAKRIAYVAAFAMSNYSSTIGRIAKPFNPMLGETFEYARHDKAYRYVSEQVSHHPPMSACWAESPHWKYYGEVDAKNKFLGRSFEIRPTGVAHATLRIPAKWVDPSKKYPTDSDVPFATNAEEPMVLEHYSWKKVTTAVSNFIMGNPIIDHFGDMLVTNHRTHETCLLTFKPRGWKAKDSCEIKGSVMDSAGQETWEIAGRWNSQLVARKVGIGRAPLLPDDSLPTTQDAGLSSPKIAPEYLLLWKNTEKPTAPFNLTPFAITLNDAPGELRDWLPPTDCRQRPDQRAFELAQYHRANDLKLAQEDKQRATRKARENGELPPHEPRWFVLMTDEDTGERVWLPRRTANKGVEYWDCRAKRDWKDVEDIFLHDEI